MTESTNRSIDGKPLTEWTREEAHAEGAGVRVGVVAIVIVAERTARLRHLIGSYSWEEN